MKTPEEIKKGLNEPELFCSHCQHSGEPHGCNRPNGSCQAFDNADDALAYIQRLEEQNAELVRETDKLQSSMGQVEKALQDNGFGSLEEFLQAYNQVKQERDAAVRDLKSVQGGQRCERCKNYGGTEFIDAVCIECKNGSIFEWRGVQELPKQEGGNDV